jgi:hypothetical protein
MTSFNAARSVGGRGRFAVMADDMALRPVQWQDGVLYSRLRADLDVDA